MSNKFTCSFPEFNFPNLPLLVKGIEVKNCSVKYAVSLQIITLSKFGCIAQWRFVPTNKTAATTKPKLTSSCVKLTSPSPPAPILCLCLLILEATKTPRAEGKWKYLIYGHFLAFVEPRWKYKIKKQTNKQTDKKNAIALRSWPWVACAQSGWDEQQVMLAGVRQGEYWLTGNKNKCQTLWNKKYKSKS